MLPDRHPEGHRCCGSRHRGVNCCHFDRRRLHRVHRWDVAFRHQEVVGSACRRDREAVQEGAGSACELSAAQCLRLPWRRHRPEQQLRQKLQRALRLLQVRAPERLRLRQPVLVLQGQQALPPGPVRQILESVQALALLPARAQARVRRLRPERAQEVPERGPVLVQALGPVSARHPRGGWPAEAAGSPWTDRERAW